MLSAAIVASRGEVVLFASEVGSGPPDFVGATTTSFCSVPATNHNMWGRRAVQRAVDELASGGAHVVLPTAGREIAVPEGDRGLGAAGVRPYSLPGLLRFITREATTDA